MSLSNPFDFIIGMQGFQATLSKDDGVTSVTVKMARANRNRNLDALEDTTYTGTEYVVSKKELDKVSFGIPTRGDYINISIDGMERPNESIVEVVEQIFLGNVIGYRLRVG